MLGCSGIALLSGETRVNILFSEVATPAHLPILNTRTFFFFEDDLYWKKKKPSHLI